ncbi:MAG: ABC-2 family transporter protein [Oligoflexia bacterium]|nr:ABC-2 family transporter protein [Oligoflexia bacterium]
MNQERGAWAFQVFSMELRKLFAYRADFWLGFSGSVLSTLGISYFLWASVFEARQASEIGGYGFHAMMLYYLAVAMVTKVVQAQEMGLVSQEIYQGTLNRYLVYPVPFFAFKFVENLAHAALFALQLPLALGLFAALFGLPPDHGVSSASVLGGVAAAFLACYLYFALGVLIELLAFWADNVWSLLVMLRITVSLLGGALLPLSVFPEELRAALSWLPFESLLSFPTRALLGELGPEEWGRHLGILLIWSFVTSVAIRLVWRRGLREYAGVGI